MRFNLLSSFAAGLFLATSICGVVYLFDKGDAPKAATAKNSGNTTTMKVQPSQQEMKSQLVSAGYIVQTKAEYDKTLNEAKSTAKKGTPADKNSNSAMTRVIINVADGMTSIDVGRMLETAKIVPNAFNFSKDIEGKGLENSLRPGVYEVDSSMSYDQVVSTIFKK